MIYIYISYHRDKKFASLKRFEILPLYFRLLGKILGLFIELLKGKQWMIQKLLQPVAWKLVDTDN